MTGMNGSAGSGGIATLVLDFVGDPLDIPRTDLENLVGYMLERASVRATLLPDAAIGGELLPSADH
jgi:hypothetical protein